MCRIAHIRRLLLIPQLQLAIPLLPTLYCHRFLYGYIVRNYVVDRDRADDINLMQHTKWYNTIANSITIYFEMETIVIQHMYSWLS